MPSSVYPLQEKEGFRYLDEGRASEAPPVVLLHGMLGDLSNWTHTVGALVDEGYRVIVPILPVYDLPMKQTSVSGLAHHVRAFFDVLGLSEAVLVGNSLGGHVAILFTLHYPDAVAALVLSGSSGIYEVEMGTSMPRRQDRSYIRERAAITFYEPAHATDELVEEMYALMNDRPRILRLIKMARSAKQETITEKLARIKVPTLLVWGRNDVITPPEVAEEFLDRLPEARLAFIDACGHAPMIEHPEDFNRLTIEFLRENVGTTVA